jgi:hypothetical protein
MEHTSQLTFFSSRIFEYRRGISCRYFVSRSNIDIPPSDSVLAFNLCKPFEFVSVGQGANYTPLAENASFKELAKYSALLERAKYAWASGESPACGCSEWKASIS